MRRNTSALKVPCYKSVDCKVTLIARYTANYGWTSKHGPIWTCSSISRCADCIWCPVPDFSRPFLHRSERRSIGHVICKTPILSSESNSIQQLFDVSCLRHACYTAWQLTCSPIKVDQGHGVYRDALLVIDIKTTHKKQHLANKAFSLSEILCGKCIV
jgi:hypothetical protein